MSVVTDWWKGNAAANTCAILKKMGVSIPNHSILSKYDHINMDIGHPCFS